MYARESCSQCNVPIKHDWGGRGQSRSVITRGRPGPPTPPHMSHPQGPCSPQPSHHQGPCPPPKSPLAKEVAAHTTQGQVGPVVPLHPHLIGCGAPAAPQIHAKHTHKAHAHRPPRAWPGSPPPLSASRRVVITKTGQTGPGAALVACCHPTAEAPVDCWCTVPPARRRPRLVFVAGAAVRSCHIHTTWQLAWRTCQLQHAHHAPAFECDQPRPSQVRYRRAGRF